MSSLKNRILVVFSLTCAIFDAAFAAPNPASVKMYDEPATGFKPNPNCDVHWQGEFAVGRRGGFYGKLQFKITPTSICDLAVPNVRYDLVFFSHPVKDSCGTFNGNFGAVKYISGRMEKDSSGQPVVYEGTFEDNRERTCEKRGGLTDPR